MERKRHHELKIGTTYAGNDPRFLEEVLPFADYLEVSPDSIAELRHDGLHLHEPTMVELRAMSKDIPIVVHGVGLSIGSHEGFSPHYIRLLDDFIGQIDVAWHSEHLGYTRVDGEYLGTMLALPKTVEALDLVCERVNTIQQRYAIPFLLENIVHVLPDAVGDYSDAAFLNALARRTGCGLLLDIYNLECDAYNHRFDMEAFFAELDFRPVQEMHITGGIIHRGVKLDVHSRLPDASTLHWARKALDRTQGAVRGITYELLDEAVPVLGHSVIAEELQRLRRLFTGATDGFSEAPALDA